MIEQSEISHHIQKHIISVLIFQKVARFRDMRAPQTDSNLYSYHLSKLIKQGFVQKVDGGYSLGTKGLVYVDRLNVDKLFVRQQAKIVTMLVIQNGYGDVLMYRKLRQPFIDLWTLPNGKVHNDDVSIAAAAKREINEKINGIDVELTHAGDCYVRFYDKDSVTTSLFVHVFYGQVGSPNLADHLQWIKLRELEEKETAPAVKEIVARTLFRDPFFFEEFEQAW